MGTHSSSAPSQLSTASFYLATKPHIIRWGPERRGVFHDTPPYDLEPIDLLVHPLELLDAVAHVLDARPEPLADVPLRVLAQVQEPLQQLAVDEAPGRLALALGVAERPVRVEPEVARRREHVGQSTLEAEEEVLRVRGHRAKEVDGAFDLFVGKKKKKLCQYAHFHT